MRKIMKNDRKGKNSALQHHRKYCSSIRLLIAVSLFAGCTLFCACTRTEKPVAPPEKIIIACATLPQTTLAQVAQTQGYYREEGLEATVHLHSYGKHALQEVLDGKADVATVAETPVMFAVMKGEQISILATIHTSSLGHAVVARKDRGINTFGDLKGKKIAATLGTSADFFLDAILLSNGISRKDVVVVHRKAEEIPDALAHGDIDAVSTFTPYVELTQKKLGDRVITFNNREIYRNTFNIVATHEFILKNPEKVRKVLRALVKAEEFVAGNTVEAQSIVANFTGIDMPVVRAFWVNAKFIVSLDQSLILALEDESSWAIKNGLTEARKAHNFLDHIYIEGLKSVKPSAVRILK